MFPLERDVLMSIGRTHFPALLKGLNDLAVTPLTYQYTVHGSYTDFIVASDIDGPFDGLDRIEFPDLRISRASDGLEAGCLLWPNARDGRRATLELFILGDGELRPDSSRWSVLEVVA